MGVLTNDFSWSKSRHEKFKECRRAYFLHYYGAWGGWEAGSDPKIRELYVLKNLSTRQQWTGNAVHDAVKGVLGSVRAGGAPELDRVLERTREKMRRDFRSSRDKQFRAAKSGKVFGLVEHEFDEEVPDAEWKRMWELAEQCLRAFFQAGHLDQARALKREQWLPIDEVDSFVMDGVKVFAAPDFAFRVDERNVALLDWKTGKPRPADHEQVRGYALFAGAKWGATPETVSGRLVYLGEGKEQTVSVDAEALAGFREHFKQSTAEMRALLRDPVKNQAHIDQFPLTDDLKSCRSCAFRRICGRDGAV